MRVLLIVLAIAFIPAGSKAQYQSFFGKTSTSWTSVGSGLQRVNEWTDSAAYEKDTIIASVEYKKVSWWRAYPDNSYMTDVFFREDTTTGRLWRRDHMDTVDKLYADLSLNVGGQYVDPITSTVPITADSVYYINSRKHIRFNTTANTYPFVFIEGVGPSVGVLWGSGLILLCQYKDGAPNYVFNVPAYPGVCNVHQLTGIDDPADVGLKIFPNPTTGVVKIVTRNTGLDLTIYGHDATGRQLLVKNCTGGGCEVNLGQFSPGLFMITIRDSKGLVIKHEKILLN